MTSTKRFLLIYALIVTAGLVSIVTLTAALDPYGLFDGLKLDRLNQNKPMQRYHDRLVKAWNGQRAAANAVLLGTSRTQVGLNPADPLFAQEGWVAYNYGLSGGTPYEALRYLQHAAAAHPIKKAFLGLDFLMFNGMNSPRNPEFAEERLLVNREGQKQPFWFLHDLPGVLLTRRALVDSLKTVVKQKAPTYLTTSGWRHPDFMAALSQEHGGTYGDFIFSEQYYMREFRCFKLSKTQAESQHLSDFRRLLIFARQKGIELHLFVSPAHMRHLLTIRTMQLWEVYEEWLRKLVRISEEERQGASLDFWNFAEANAYTTENLPSPQSQDAMNWYWESSHYKENLGRLMLKRILKHEDADPGFGTILNSSAMDQELARLRREVDDFGRSRPEAIQEQEGSRDRMYGQEGGC